MEILLKTSLCQCRSKIKWGIKIVMQMSFGSRAHFAVEIASVDFAIDLAEVQIWIAGVPIVRNPVAWRTFVAASECVLILQESGPPTEFDFGSLSPEHTFQFLFDVLEGDLKCDILTAAQIERYHLLYDLDDALDGVYLFVVDVDDCKRLMFRSKPFASHLEEYLHTVVSVDVPKDEFIGVWRSLCEYQIVCGQNK